VPGRRHPRPARPGLAAAETDPRPGQLRTGHGSQPALADQTNLEQLREQLPRHWQALGGEAIEIVDRRAAVRCQTPDFLPLAGPLADPGELPHRIVPDVYLNLAHGSRGITHTPLCADLVADLASDLTPFPDAELINALAPERFILRRRRREPDWKAEPGTDGPGLTRRKPIS